jgi:hypothetical protein
MAGRGSERSGRADTKYSSCLGRVVGQEPAEPFSEAVSSGKAAAEADQQQEEEDEIVCAVCLDPFSAEEPPTALACRHDFHAGCIEAWRESCAVRGWKWSCPVCRQG